MSVVTRIRTSQELTVPYSKAEVWSVLEDVASYPEWWPANLRVEVVHYKGELLGAEFEVRPLLGRMIRMRFEELEGRSSMRLRFFGGSLEGPGGFHLMDLDGETRVRYEMDVFARGLDVAALSVVLPPDWIHRSRMRSVLNCLASRLKARRRAADRDGQRVEGHGGRETARQKAEDEAADRRAAEEGKRRAEQEAAARAALEEEQRRAAEAEANRRASEEAARKRAEEEAIARAAEEEAERLAAEEEKARLAAEEAKRRAEEEAAARAALEAEQRRTAEEEANRRASEEAAKKRAEEEAIARAAEEEAERRAAEEEKARLAAEEAKRRAEEEAAARASLQEEQRRAAEAEANRRASEEAARRRAEEEARGPAARETAVGPGAQVAMSDLSGELDHADPAGARSTESRLRSLWRRLGGWLKEAPAPSATARLEAPQGETNFEIARRYLGALSSNAKPEEISGYFAPEVTDEEFPHRFLEVPLTSGLSGILEAMRASSRRLSWQRYELAGATGGGSQVALEVRWRGSVAADGSEGQEFDARIAIFLKFSGGRIVRQRSYRCFEPWSTRAERAVILDERVTQAGQRTKTIDYGMEAPRLRPDGSNFEIARSYIEALNGRADGEMIERFFASGAVQDEFPNRLLPEGAHRDLVAIKLAQSRRLSLMSSEHYELVGATGGGSQVALEIAWSGVVGDGFGLFAAGQRLEARSAIFLKFRDGLIVAQRNYNCPLRGAES